MGTDSSGTSETMGSPLTIAETTFRLLACEPGGLTLNCAGLAKELPQREVGMIELRDLLCGPAVSNPARDAVWRELVTLARYGGPSRLVAAVGMAAPALKRIAGTITRGYLAGDRHDLDTEVLAAFLEALRDVDLDRPNIRPRLCDAARRAGERARQNAEAGVCRRLPARASATPKTPWNHPDFVLGDAVAKGVLSELDAELIGRTRLEELTLAQAAAELGLTTEAAKKRRQRAEPVLCEAVRSGEVQAALSLTITSSDASRSEASTSARSRDTSDTRSEITEPKGGWGPLPGSARSALPVVTAARLYPCGAPSCGSRRRRTLRTGLLRLAVLVGIVIVVLLIGGAAAYAGVPVEPGDPPKEPESLQQVINNLRDWLIGLLVALATLMATIGGIRYLLAGGDPGEVGKAKNTLKYAALGYAVAALAPLLVKALKSIVGV